MKRPEPREFLPPLLRTKLLMSMEGGLSAKVKVMENLDHLAAGCL